MRAVLTQHFWTHRVDDHKTAMRALAAAMLQRAVDDLQLGGWIRETAIAWFSEARGETDPGSLAWCCSVLDIDPDAVRRRCGRESRSPGQPHRDR